MLLKRIVGKKEKFYEYNGEMYAQSYFMMMRIASLINMLRGKRHGIRINNTEDIRPIFIFKNMYQGRRLNYSYCLNDNTVVNRGDNPYIVLKEIDNR